MDTPAHSFMNARGHLTVGDATAAIIVIEDGRYLLQLRDDIDPIWYPGHWGCFGGGVDPGEDSLAALRRELCEELQYDMRDAHFLLELDFDLSGMNLGRYYRKYYVVPMTLDEMARISLGEGKAVAAFDRDTALSVLKVVPYDAFALFLHARALRLKDGWQVIK